MTCKNIAQVTIYFVYSCRGTYFLCALDLVYLMWFLGIFQSLYAKYEFLKYIVREIMNFLSKIITTEMHFLTILKCLY